MRPLDVCAMALAAVLMRMAHDLADAFDLRERPQCGVAAMVTTIAQEQVSPVTARRCG